MPLAAVGGNDDGSEAMYELGSEGAAAGETLFGFGAFFFAAGFAFARTGFGTGAAFRALFDFTAFFAALTGLAFFFLATRFFAAGRLAFAAGRFLDLLFFAMVTCLLAFDPTTRYESSPEKVRCHLWLALELNIRIA